MTALYVTYTLESPDGDRALAIHLQQPDGARTPPHDLLRELHRAMATWSAAHPDVFVHSDLGVAPGAGAVQRGIADYRYAGGAVNGSRLERHLDMVLKTGRIHTFALRPGAPVDGRDLVGRQDTLTALREKLRHGSVHLKAPRRYGKTSVLRHLKKTLSEEGEACLYVDVSPGSSASWFLVTLVREAMEVPLCRPALQALPELADWPEPDAEPIQRSLAARRLEESLRPNVRSTGQRLLDALGSVGTIVLVDEFSVFLRRFLDQEREEMKMVSEILARSRQTPQPTRQVLAGSAGLSSFLYLHELSAPFGDLKGVQLEPLAVGDAAVLTEELLYGARQLPSPEVVEQVLREVGAPIPFFLHVLVDATCQKSDEVGRLDADVVRRAYREGLLGSGGNTYFRDYKLDHQPYPPSLRGAAGELLRELAGEPDGITTPRLLEIFRKTGAEPKRFEPLLSCLQEDYDLTEQGERWTMRPKVLRDRWSQREPWLTGESS